MKMVEWMEPFDEEGKYPLKCSILLDHAVEWQKALAAKENASYSTDADALDDFVQVRSHCKIFDIVVQEKSKILLF